jgi:O-acetyl-ADP-ribose deacetylase (regulator of RNase III)
VVTPAFRLTTASWVVHAVGPRYSGPQDEPVRAAAYTAALARADEVRRQSAAFPSIATGRYGYPDADAVRISVTALREARTSVRTSCSWPSRATVAL